MEYRGIIFTKHALERLASRAITKDMVVQAVLQPHKTYQASKKNTFKFIKTIDNRKLHVVASKTPDLGKWLIVSVWVRGEDDALPFVWQLLTAPFKFVWWILKNVWRKLR